MAALCGSVKANETSTEEALSVGLHEDGRVWVGRLKERAGEEGRKDPAGHFGQVGSVWSKSSIQLEWLCYYCVTLSKIT